MNVNNSKKTKGGWTHQNCCWEEDDIMNPGEKIKWCQDYIVDPRHPNPTCEPAEDFTGFGQNTPE